MGVYQKHLAVGQHEAVHGTVGVAACAATQYLVHIMQMQGVCTKGSADHAIRIAFVNHHGANQGVAATHFNFRVGLCDTLALGQVVVHTPVVFVALIVLGVDQLKINTRLNAQTKTFQAALNHRRATNHDGLGNCFIDHHLHCAHHALIFALSKYNPGRLRCFGHTTFGHRKNWLHERARVIYKLL